MRSDELREKVRVYKRAFSGAEPRGLAARIGARLGLAWLARYVLSDQLWLGIVLADLERFCHARHDQTTFVLDDPTGRDQAQLEGRRQVYLRLSGYLAMTPLELSRLADVQSDATDEEDQTRAA